MRRIAPDGQLHVVAAQLIAQLVQVATHSLEGIRAGGETDAQLPVRRKLHLRNANV